MCGALASGSVTHRQQPDGFYSSTGVSIDAQGEVVVVGWENGQVSWLDLRRQDGVGSGGG